MENLKDFMLLFRMEFKPKNRPSEEASMAIKKSWGQWIGGIGGKARLVSSHQLGLEGKVMSGGSQVREGFEIKDAQSISGNLVLKATDLEEACEMAKGCPILAVGGTVEIRNTLNVF